MVNKEELLKDLKNDLSFEEDIIGKLSDFYKALGWRQVLKQHDHKSIEDGLNRLKEDSEKHAGMITDMVQYVEGSPKNEF